MSNVVTYARFGAIVLGTFLATGCKAEPDLFGKKLSAAFPNVEVAQLVIAAEDGDIKSVEALIRKGVDVNFVGDDGITPLIWCELRENISAVGLLLDKGADSNRGMSRGMTAVMFAARRQRPDILELLLKRGGDPNQFDAVGDTALSHAVANRRDASIDILLKYGAKPYIKMRRTTESPGENGVVLGAPEYALRFVKDGLYTENVEALARTVARRVYAPGDACQTQRELLIELGRRGVDIPEVIRTSGHLDIKGMCYPSNEELGNKRVN